MSPQKIASKHAIVLTMDVPLKFAGMSPTMLLIISLTLAQNLGEYFFGKLKDNDLQTKNIYFGKCLQQYEPNRTPLFPHCLEKNKRILCLHGNYFIYPQTPGKTSQKRHNFLFFFNFLFTSEFSYFFYHKFLEIFLMKKLQNNSKKINFVFLFSLCLLFVVQWLLDKNGQRIH
jgi:hypothetical protein